jgi:hypothetical protein
MTWNTPDTSDTMGTVDTTEPVTTVKIYASDRDWLTSRQRRLAADNDKWLPMCDILHGLIIAIQTADEGA